MLPGRSQNSVRFKWYALHDPEYGKDADPGNRGKRYSTPLRSMVSTAMMTMPGHTGTVGEICLPVYEKHGHELNHATGVKLFLPSPTAPLY
jgi:hypothetical protein